MAAAARAACTPRSMAWPAATASSPSGRQNQSWKSPPKMFRLRRPAGQVPAPQQRRDGGQLVALQTLGGRQSASRSRPPQRLPEEHFPFQIGGQRPATISSRFVCRRKIAFLPAKHPERAQDRRGGGNRHADGGGKILGHVPVRHHVGVFQDHGMAQQGLQVAMPALQRPRRGGEPIMGQTPARPQFQLAGGIVQQIQRGRLAIDGLGAAAGRPASGRPGGSPFGVRQQRTPAASSAPRCQRARRDSSISLNMAASAVNDRRPPPPAPADWLVRRRDRWARRWPRPGGGSGFFRRPGNVGAHLAAASGSSLRCPRVVPTPGSTGADQLRPFCSPARGAGAAPPR